MTDDYYEKQLRIEQAARRMVVEQLLNQLIIEVHEHRDQMKETDTWHNEHKEKLIDHIEDLNRYAKRLEREILEAKGSVETTDCPFLDYEEMKPKRVVAYL